MSKAIRDLQALRGLACLAVLFYHMAGLESQSAWQYRLLPAFDRFGYAGVDLFFVLSGFIIMNANFAKLGQPAALFPFLRNRLWRTLFDILDLLPRHHSALPLGPGKLLLPRLFPPRFLSPAARAASPAELRHPAGMDAEL